MEVFSLAGFTGARCHQELRKAILSVVGEKSISVFTGVSEFQEKEFLKFGHLCIFLCWKVLMLKQLEFILIIYRSLLVN
jgi:hypothetical protein